MERAEKTHTWCVSQQREGLLGVSRGSALALMLSVVALGACETDGGGGYIFAEASAADLPAQDATVSGAAFGELCVDDASCLSGHCVDMGAVRRCTKTCAKSTDCPSLDGWSCDGTCACVPAAQGEETCGTDLDCDGAADAPERSETCNQLDDDCNGTVDDVAANQAGAKLYYPDSDKDGHGDGGRPTWLCGPRAGYVSSGDDCDDSLKLVNPTQPEICGDFMDNDCDLRMDDPDECGFTPVTVADITAKDLSASLTSCAVDPTVPAGLDLREIVAKQDKEHIKFTVRVGGSPWVSNACASYTLAFGDESDPLAVVYVFRPALACTLGRIEAYYGGVAFATNAVTGFNAASPGHVSFSIPKAEFLGAARLPTPTYWLRACSNRIANATSDRTGCEADSCTTRVHR